MGTRSITRVKDRGETIVALYRMYDGYPSGHGQELADFMSPLRLTNGLPPDATNVANGAGCFAAQMVAHFKQEPGGFYLYPMAATADASYVYEINIGFIDGSSDPLTVTAFKGKERIFNGTRNEFAEWVREEGGD